MRSTPHFTFGSWLSASFFCAWTASLWHRACVIFGAACAGVTDAGRIAASATRRERRPVVSLSTAKLILFVGTVPRALTVVIL